MVVMVRGKRANIVRISYSIPPFRHRTVAETRALAAVSIFVGYDGKPTRKYGLTWSETPSSVCTCSDAKSVAGVNATTAVFRVH